MSREPSLLGRIFTGLSFFFLYAPIFVLIAFSFNSSKSRSIWTGFSLQWYEALMENESILNALRVTLTVSVLASVIAALVGTFAAIGFFNMKRRWRSPLLAINNIPVMNADIITGVSLSLLFVAAFAALNKLPFVNFRMGFGTLLIAHVTFNIPYVILSVMPKLYQLDKNLFEAAQDLGCTWMQAFWKVIIPEIRPGIVNGLITAFTMSVDDFVISYFTAGSSVETLSMAIYSMTRKKISPEINAISTILFVTVLLLLILVNVREAHQAKVQARRDKMGG